MYNEHGSPTQLLEEWASPKGREQEQQTTSLGRLPGGAVHEFNDLLTAILGYGDLLLSEPRITGAERESVRQIVRAAEAGAALTRRLMAQAREQAAGPQSFAPAAIEEVVPAEVRWRTSALPPPGGSETVLVVEPEKAVRDVICRTLRQEGYTVLEAGDADEAAAVLDRDRGRVHLLVTDTVLAKTVGPPLSPGVKVLYLSSHSRSPGGHCLPKPFTLDGLVSKVREVLDSEG